MVFPDTFVASQKEIFDLKDNMVIFRDVNETSTSHVIAEAFTLTLTLTAP